MNRLADLYEVEYVKRQVEQLPQTFAAFCGSSGRSVKIWVKFVLPDGNLPVKEENITLFHACAYRMAVQCYQPILPFPITLKEPNPAQSCRMTLDTDPYFNPDAIAFCQEQPFSMPGEQTFHQRKLTEKNPLLRLKPGFETSETFTILFETTLGKALDEMQNWKRGDTLHPLLVCLAENCFKAGIPEEETVRQVMIHYYRQADEQDVRITIHNLYRECKGFGKKSALTPEQKISLQLEEFMGRRYEFRFNTVSNDLEFRQKDSIHFYFQPVDQRARNSISMDALQEGIKVWDRDVNRYLASNRVPLYNPVEDYLCSVGRWDGKDRIHALADLVPCNNPHWRQLFYRWFLNMVAHWRGMDKRYANSVSPLLVGAQGTRKSTFCRSIMPPSECSYYTDSLDFSRKKDVELSLNRFALINIDEFDQVSATQQGFLKHILQKPVVNARRPYGTSVVEMRRYASFIATSNHKDLLTDPSGSRRFICIEVKGVIDTSRPIDYDQLYAQAMHELAHGERYWFNDADEYVMTEANREFQQYSPEEQFLFRYFRMAEAGEEGEWMAPAEILKILHQEVDIPLNAKRVAAFGRILRKQGIPSRHTRKGTVYQLVRAW